MDSLTHNSRLAQITRVAIGAILLVSMAGKLLAIFWIHDHHWPETLIGRHPVFQAFAIAAEAVLVFLLCSMKSSWIAEVLTFIGSSIVAVTYSAMLAMQLTLPKCGCFGGLAVSELGHIGIVEALMFFSALSIVEWSPSRDSGERFDATVSS